MTPDVVAHMSEPPPRRPSLPSYLFMGVVGVIVVIWAVESIAATLGYAMQPDPTLTLTVSGLVGALATAAIHSR